MKRVARVESRPWRSLTGLLLFGVGAALLGGCASHLEVLRQATPNPFEKAAAFSVLPIRMSSLTVDGMPEAEFKNSKRAEAVASWDTDKKSVNDMFLKTLVETAKRSGIEVSESSSSAPFTIEPRIDAIETGYYRIPAWNAVTRITVNMKILDKNGNVLDEVLVKDSAAFDVFSPDTGGRMRAVARVIGEQAAVYLDSRVNP